MTGNRPFLYSICFLIKDFSHSLVTGKIKNVTEQLPLFQFIEISFIGSSTNIHTHTHTHIYIYIYIYIYNIYIYIISNI